MKKLLSTTFIIAILIISFSFKGLQSEKFDVEILQDGESVEIVNNRVFLDKKEFKIRVTLKNHEGVYMSSSFQTDYFSLNDNDPIKDFEWLGAKSRAEVKFNGDKELRINKEIVSYLFYDPELDWHRFDKDIILEQNKVIGVKTIERIYDEDIEKSINLSDISNDIFLFFVASGKYKNGKIPDEYGRIKIQIKWK